jgi:hypothetical protein
MKTAIQTENETKRAFAAQIAHDLVEGGIEDASTIRVNAEHYNVSQSVVRAIRELVCKHDAMVSQFIGPMRQRRYDMHLRNDQSRCSMVDAIANGWEDAAVAKIFATRSMNKRLREI